GPDGNHNGDDRPNDVTRSSAVELEMNIEQSPERIFEASQNIASVLAEMNVFSASDGEAENVDERNFYQPSRAIPAGAEDQDEDRVPPAVGTMSHDLLAVYDSQTQNVDALEPQEVLPDESHTNQRTRSAAPLNKIASSTSEEASSSRAAQLRDHADNEDEFVHTDEPDDEQFIYKPSPPAQGGSRRISSHQVSSQPLRLLSQTKNLKDLELA
ncbi:unnamed protein product, partial [Amoebophrya sp. A120]